MFTDSKDGNREAVMEGKEGWWAVRVDTDQYRAWQYWLLTERIHCKFWPEKYMTVLGQWPPTTQRGADSVAKAISEIRDNPYGKEALPIGGDPVPRHPEPWDGVIPKFIGSEK